MSRSSSRSGPRWGSMSSSSSRTGRWPRVYDDEEADEWWAPPPAPRTITIEPLTTAEVVAESIAERARDELEEAADELEEAAIVRRGEWDRPLLAEASL